MLKPLLKKAIPLLTMIPLLGSCSLFQPKTKVIEYDEEVKLHDGSMIWVHIKRHYGRSSGCEISNCFQGYEKGWGAKEVEISWDTGFPNVGRKSVFFDKKVYFIEKINDSWYVVGYGQRSDNLSIGDSINCRKIGLNINQGYDCQFAIDKNGHLINQELKDIGLVNMNILNVDGIKQNGDYNLDFLNRKQLYWSEKLALQDTQSESSRFVNRPYSYQIISK